jgi:oxalate decarboxylase/phosphoglucose isomerase-like protein (cupin superfamily)
VPGDLVYIPPNAKHATKVIGDEDVHALMIYEPAGYERNYMRRRALTEEQRQDPEVMRKMMYEADVHMNR